MAERQGVPNSGPRPLNILIVDDSATMRTMVKRAARVCVEPIGQIFEASDGAEALRVLETNDIDALFTDINMPVMTGMQLLREIGKHRRYDNVARVIISADGSSARRDDVKDLHVRLYVAKPFRPEVIRDALAEITTSAGVR